MLRMLEASTAIELIDKTSPFRSSTGLNLRTGSQSTIQIIRTIASMMGQASQGKVVNELPPLRNSATAATSGIGVARRSRRSQYVPLIRVIGLPCMEPKMPETRCRGIPGIGFGSGAKVRGSEGAEYGRAIKQGKTYVQRVSGGSP